MPRNPERKCWNGITGNEKVFYFSLFFLPEISERLSLQFIILFFFFLPVEGYQYGGTSRFSWIYVFGSMRERERLILHVTFQKKL